MNLRALCRSLWRGRAGNAERPPEAAELLERLSSLDARLSRLEQLAHGGKTVYLGNNRVLTKISLGRWNIGYLLEADDLLLAPPLILNGYHEIDVTDYFVNTIQEHFNCLDVGANFGYFTCIMGRWAPHGTTIALEPDPKTFELLRDNIYINNIEGIAAVRNLAAADFDGALRLHRRIKRSGNTSIARLPDEALAGIGEPPSEPFDVACTRIDALLPEFAGRIDCIKIDVEGAEPLVMRGAHETIVRNPGVAIVMEWAPSQLRTAGFDPGEFAAELAGLGLGAAAIGTGGVAQPLGWDALLALPYHPGIRLGRAG